MAKRPPLEGPASPYPQSQTGGIQMNIDRVTEESLTSTRRMQVLCEEAQEAGIKTLVALDDQGEQLDHIEKGLRDIHEDMVEAEKALQGMNDCCWGVCAPCTKKSPDAAAFKMNDDGKKGGGERRPELSNEGVPTYGGFISKFTNTAEEEEMERHMNGLVNTITKLRLIALDIDSEISNQTLQVDRINSMAEDNSERLTKASERTNKLRK